MKNRKMMIAAAAAAMTAVMSIPAFAQGWALNGNTWYYTDKNGSNVSESWQMSGDNWFYLGSTGAMEKDSVVEYKDHVYYVNEDGAMVTNCWRRLEYDGEECWMYFGPDGRAMEKGWKTIDEKKYHFTDFRMDYGWFENESNGARYYLGTENEGWIQQGWAFLGDDDDADKEEGWYYIKATGKYVTDKEEKIDGAYYAAAVRMDGAISRTSRRARILRLDPRRAGTILRTAFPTAPLIRRKPSRTAMASRRSTAVTSALTRMARW